MKGSLVIARFVMTHRLENSMSCQHFGQHKGQKRPADGATSWINEQVKQIVEECLCKISQRSIPQRLYKVSASMHATSGATRAWIKEIFTVAPTKALLRAVAARCNLFYGFSHKFFSHWDHCSCLSFTSVSAHSLLQHQSVITPASGHELSLFVAITKARQRARDIIAKYIYFTLCVCQ